MTRLSERLRVGCQEVILESATYLGVQRSMIQRHLVDGRDFNLSCRTLLCTILILIRHRTFTALKRHLSFGNVNPAANSSGASDR